MPDQISTSWSDERIATFLESVRTGKITPLSSGHSEDDNGPLTYFNFAEYRCEIHVHWKTPEREEMSVAHIKNLDDGSRITPIVDSQTIAMLRHYSGLDEKQSIDSDSIDEQIVLLIHEKLIGFGLKEMSVADQLYSRAYIRKSRLRGSVVFLIAKSYSSGTGVHDYVEQARKWCKNELNAMRMLNEMLLNIVLIHEGSIGKLQLAGVTDKTGFHRTLIRSITVINNQTNEILQNAVWTNTLWNASNLVSKAVDSIKHIKFK